MFVSSAKSMEESNSIPNFYEYCLCKLKREVALKMSLVELHK